MSKRCASLTGYKPLLFTYPRKFPFNPGSCSRGPPLCPAMSLKGMLGAGRDSGHAPGGQPRGSGCGAGCCCGARGDAAVPGEMLSVPPPCCHSVPPRAVSPSPPAARCPWPGRGPARAEARTAQRPLAARGRRGQHLPGAPGPVRLRMDPCPAPSDNPALTGGRDSSSAADAARRKDWRTASAKAHTRASLFSPKRFSGQRLPLSREACRGASHTSRRHVYEISFPWR